MAGKKIGRPRVEIDMALLKQLCTIQCTEEECAAVIGVDADTIASRIKENGYKSFSEFLKKHSGSGRASLRRAQWKSAVGDKGTPGNITMQIWLGKQMLGQRDKQEIEQGGSIEVKITREIKDKGECE